jgi:hypothetical protein
MPGFSEVNESADTAEMLERGDFLLMAPRSKVPAGM